MTAYYDPIASPYKKSKELPCRLIEAYTYFHLLGNLTGKSILDLGCGEGFYTRKFKQKGAQRVVGVDISPEMIALARSEETKEPLGIEYVIADVCSLGILGSFELVVASYLLNHAQSRQQLLSICQTIFANLKPSGRFVGLDNNGEQPPSSYSLCSKYGFTKSISQPLEEGTPITITFTNPDTQEKFSIEDYYFSQATYEWAFRSVGFKEIHWYPPRVSPEIVQEFSQEFWQDFLDYAPFVGIECLK